ncbi:MAG: CBS domain-containing protein [Alphaproteobacteria bacterium]|jgi:CBS domain-containing protein|nr:CBS domain-containing protein [Alphaproteobacteria bacterium]
MLVSDALDRKGTDVVTTTAETAIVDVARLLKGRGVGVIVVTNATGAVAGILSERDIVHGIAMHGKDAVDFRVRDLMSDQIVTCGRKDTIDQAMQQMIAHACRHLPVVENGALKGLVSMSDVVKLRLQDLHQLAAAAAPAGADEDLDGWPVKA